MTWVMYNKYTNCILIFFTGATFVFTVYSLAKFIMNYLYLLEYAKVYFNI